MKANVHTRAVGRLALACGHMAAAALPAMAQDDVPREAPGVDRDLFRVGTIVLVSFG